MAQQQAYNHYPWAIIKKYHTGVHWANAIVQRLLMYNLALWNNRCDLKNGKAPKQQTILQRSKLLPLY